MVFGRPRGYTGKIVDLVVKAKNSVKGVKFEKFCMDFGLEILWFLGDQGGIQGKCGF